MDISNICERKEFSGLLFSQPRYFRVEYKINPYMVKDVNRKNARTNWCETIISARDYKSIQTVDYDTFKYKNYNIKDYPDSVFCANHAMPTPHSGFILSNMKHKERDKEPFFFEQWARHNNYSIQKINKNISFEGEGDAKWHPKKNLVWIGYGQRTDKEAIPKIEKIIDAKVIGLELTSPLYYHLDVCFTPLDESKVLIIPEAFSKDSLNKIESTFDTVFYVPNTDKKTMGGNCSRITENTILIDKQNSKTIQFLENNNYTVVDVDTKEFQKSGGSTDCLYINIP